MLVGSRCLFRRCPAGSSSATAPPANIFFPMALPGSSISATVQPLATAPPLATASPLVAAPQPATSSRWRFATAPLPAVSLPLRPPLTSSSRWRSATAPLPAVSLPLRRPRPATNLIWQRSTPVWLAIWRTWTGFANSQLRCANFPALIYIYASIPIAATLESLLRQTQIFRPICTDCLRHLRISAG